MTYRCIICPKQTEELAQDWIVVLEVNEPLSIVDERTGVEIRDNRMNVLATACSWACGASYTANQHRLNLKVAKRKIR